jgi:CRISPR-associated protein Cmr3
MSARTIFIEPSDVWLFRDARPFAAGDQGRAASIFPPTPHTVQGAIRSARLATSGASFTSQETWPEDVGKPENFGALTLRGPLLARRDSSGVPRPFFQLPGDVSKTKSGWRVLKPGGGPDFRANWEAGLRPVLPDTNGEPVKFNTGWLSDEGLTAYLSGSDFGSHFHESSELFERESRFGIQIDGGPKRTEEGMLYQVEFVRMREGAGLLVELKGIPLPERGLLQLGGEARAARYEQADASLDLMREGRLMGRSAATRFKLYLATPALFRRGWLPEALDSQSLSGLWRSIDLKLISAAVGRPQAIGGRDISQKDRQRAVRRAVPAGSVYFFETGATAEEVFGAFDGQCVSDADAQIGFGLCYVGGW